MMESSKANIGLVSLELSQRQRKVQWMGGPPDPDEDVNHDLKLHQIVVGKSAKKDEEQVIEVEFVSTDKKNSVVPIAYLARGQQNQVILQDVMFPAGASFHLAEGDGPVHVLGSHVISAQPEDDIMEAEDVDEEEEDEDDEENADGEIITRELDYEAKLISDTNGSKKRKPEDRENGGDPKKLKSSKNSNSDLDDENDEDGADGSLE